MSDKGYFEIDKLKGKTKNRIYRVGVELEGAWEKTPKFKYGEKIDHDGSVKIEPIPIPPPPTAEAPPEEPLTDRIFRIRRAVEMYNDGMRAENRVSLVDIIDNQLRL
jgi:hypothetical protein